MTIDMKRRAVLAAILTVPAGIAFAQPYGWGQGGPPFGGGPGGRGGPPYGGGGPGGWGWRQGPRGYSSGTEVDRGKVEAAVKEALGKATKGTSWASPRGPKMTPIVVDNEVVGQLWEDADPKTLTIAEVWPGPGGTRVQLAKNGKVIGMLWVKVS